MKTRSYLTLMAAVILIPVVIFSGVGLDMLLERERESRIHVMEETARTTALAIDQEIAQAESALNVLVNTPFIKTDDFPTLYALMNQGKKTEYTWNTVFDYEGNPLTTTRRPLETKMPVTGYKWVAPIIDSQKSSVSDLRFSSLSKFPVISVDVPVPAASGKKYLISQVFHAEHFSRLLDSRGISPTWVVGLFGSDGISIARNANVHELVGQPVRPELYRASQQQFSGRTRHVTREGVAVYSVFTHTERTGWTVAIGVPQAEIEAPARRAAWYAALALGLTFALATLVIFTLARRLAHSVEDMVDAAHVLGEGHIPEVIPSGVEEVDTLQSALHEAGTALSRQNEARLALEKERERLLHSEQEARKQAEHQNKAKDEFLAMLGHELRNPLAPISTAAQILKMAASDDKRVRHCSEVIDRQVTHMTELVNDLLDVSRVTRGLVELKKEAVDIGSVVSSAIEQARPLIEARNHALTTDPGACQVVVHADRTRLVQVIANLLTNAAKYTPQGGQITLSVQVQQAQVRISVSDDGLGIEPALLPHVFDLFTQAERTPDRSQGGLGLGLALVKSIMALHGGQVQAVSEGAGKGSTFTLVLPLRACEALVQAAQPAQPIEAVEPIEPAQPV